MGEYLVVPGADFSAAAGKIGTLALPARDALPILGVPGLAGWWSGDDASVADTTLTWADRKANAAGVRTQPTGMPAVQTVDGFQSLYCNTAGFTIPPALLNVANWHMMFVLKVPTITAEQGLIGQDAGNPNSVRVSIFSDGSIRGATSGTVMSALIGGSPAPMIANTMTLLEVSWDAANKFTVTKNGTQLVTGVGSAAATPVPSKLVIGAGMSNIATGLKGNIFECLLFSRNMRVAADDLANLQWLRRRLGAQYAVTIA